MGFDNLKDSWERISAKYHSKTSDWEKHLEAHDRLTEMGNVQTERYDQANTIPIIKQSNLFEIDKRTYRRI